MFYTNDSKTDSITSRSPRAQESLKICCSRKFSPWHKQINKKLSKQCVWLIQATANWSWRLPQNPLRIVYRKKELKATILALQLESLEKQKYDSENKSKPSQSLSYLTPDNCRYYKKLTEEKKLSRTEEKGKFEKQSPPVPKHTQKVYFSPPGRQFLFKKWGQSILSHTPEPTIKLKAEHQELNFLIDTDVTFSTIHSGHLSLCVTSDSI